MPVSLLSVYNKMTGSLEMEFLMSGLIPRILIFHCWPYTKSHQINTAMPTNATFVLVYSGVLLDISFTFQVLNGK